VVSCRAKRVCDTVGVCRISKRSGKSRKMSVVWYEPVRRQDAKTPIQRIIQKDRGRGGRESGFLQERQKRLVVGDVEGGWLMI